MSARVLIVDDVAANRIIHQARLAAAFYEPLLASNGLTCLMIARDERPDVVLLDLGLPGVSGLDVLRLRFAQAALDIGQHQAFQRDSLQRGACLERSEQGVWKIKRSFHVCILVFLYFYALLKIHH